MNNSKLISGFTFIKNGLTLGYPIKESIESIEPLCDEIIINVGFDNIELKNDDGTFDYLNDHFKHPKFKFLKSYWNPSLRKDGLILSEQTNIALKECKGKYCQYIQGDEVIHEDDLPLIQNAVMDMEENNLIEGLVFNYLHFYGNVDIIKHTRNTYRREVRLIRNHSGIKSWKDAQGFKHSDERKLNCIQIPARIFHYGWARKEQVMKKKVMEFDKLYHEEDKAPSFQYERIWGLKRFTETHPQVVKKWVLENKNEIDILALKTKFERKNISLCLSDLIESITGYRIGEYKNFKLL